MSIAPTIESLAATLDLGALLGRLTARYGTYNLVAHWTQGEFHHDVVVRLPEAARCDLGAEVLVVATNCNGGVKEVIAFDEVPLRGALWHERCPDVPEFVGTLAPVRARARTLHWFDPCELLLTTARSELRPEHRRRQEGGGWEAATEAAHTKCGGRSEA